jgi:hypothetical protein
LPRRVGSIYPADVAREDRNELARAVERRLDRLRERMRAARHRDISRGLLAASASELRHRSAAETASPLSAWFYLWRAQRSRRRADRYREEMEALERGAE